MPTRSICAATIEGALDVMGPIAAKKGLELAYALDPDLPGTLSSATPGGCARSCSTCCRNAIKFTDTGEVSVSVTGSRIDAGDHADEPGRWAVGLEIHDTGIGIPADRIGRLFQSFSQADASISRRYGGTGLGLAISRRLAELMDGSLVAESAGDPGRGQHVPARRPNLPAAPDRGGRRDRRRRSDLAGPPGPGRRRQRDEPADPGRQLERLGHRRHVDRIRRSRPAIWRPPGRSLRRRRHRPADAGARRHRRWQPPSGRRAADGRAAGHRPVVARPARARRARRRRLPDQAGEAGSTAGRPSSRS